MTDSPKKSSETERDKAFEEAVDSAKTPMAALVAAYNHAPHAILREYIDQKVHRLLMADLPKLQALMQAGPVIEKSDIKSLGDSYRHVFEMAKEIDPGVTKRVSATVIDCGAEIGHKVDESIRRILLDDKSANRKALYDVVTSHTDLCRALAELQLTPEQEASIRKSEGEVH